MPDTTRVRAGGATNRAAHRLPRGGEADTECPNRSGREGDRDEQLRADHDGGSLRPRKDRAGWAHVHHVEDGERRRHGDPDRRDAQPTYTHILSLGHYTTRRKDRE